MVLILRLLSMPSRITPLDLPRASSILEQVNRMLDAQQTLDHGREFHVS